MIAQRPFGVALRRSRLIEKNTQNRVLRRFVKFVFQRVDGAYRLGDFSAKALPFRAGGGGHFRQSTRLASRSQASAAVLGNFWAVRNLRC